MHLIYLLFLLLNIYNFLINKIKFTFIKLKNLSSLWIYLRDFFYFIIFGHEILLESNEFKSLAYSISIPFILNSLIS